MAKKIIVRFYNWQDWKKNISEGVIGHLGSNVINKSYLKLAAREAESEENEVWLLAATKDKKWRVSAWLKLRPRKTNEPESDNKYSTIVYYDVNASKIIGNYKTGKLADIPEVENVLNSYGKNLEVIGQAGFQLVGPSGRKVFNSMQKVQGESFPHQYLNIDTDIVRLDQINYKKTTNVKSDVTSSIDFEVVDNDLLKSKLALESVMKIIDEEYKNKPGEDVDAIVKRRVGQSEFRNLLEKIYGASCHVSNIDKRKLLIASHIVPWSKSTGDEKTDPENGLLLAVNWDAVFDKGLVCFDDEGKVNFSEDLDTETIHQLGLDRNEYLNKIVLTTQRRSYLKRHKDEIFESWKML